LSRNEADIIESWVRHTLAEDVDRIYIADGISTDGTREILDELAGETGQIVVIDDTEQYCLQAQWMNRLAAMAGEDGFQWIIASDVDEFWYACDGRTIAEVLETVEVDRINARSYQHHDWNTRQVEPKRLPKVCFRWRSDAHLVMGNHDVSGVGGGAYGIMDLREYQFRSFDHYCAKVRARLATLEPAARARGDGWHYIRLQDKTESELRDEWNQMMATPVILDPIPTHLPSVSSYLCGDRRTLLTSA
jgi:hypothetical protein